MAIESVCKFIVNRDMTLSPVSYEYFVDEIKLSNAVDLSMREYIEELNYSILSRQKSEEDNLDKLNVSSVTASMSNMSVPDLEFD